MGVCSTALIQNFTSKLYIHNTHANIIDVISIKQLHPYLTYNEEDINIFQTQKGVKGVQSLSVADFRMSDLRRNHS